MKRLESLYVTTPPDKRPLKIYASDPMAPGNRISVDIRNEDVSPGPVGEKIEVVDYDSEHDCYYAPLDLNDPSILMQGGLEPNESDPRFHQQMVYAVAMKTIENFERALGRQIAFKRRPGQERLRLFPHAFHGANAFFDPKLNAVLFGYFRADRDNPGPNLPGQNVFTCLSHDIIAHEMTHAVVHRLRRYFLDPSNEDVLAFHEGFSDIVALFQHFSFGEMLREHIQTQRTQIRQADMMVGLAQQFGYATGMGMALRSAIGKPDRRLYATLTEPHARGAILVAAVFDAFFQVYQRRIRDLIRIATGGTGNLPDADLHPDLVNRVADEASETAQSILNMCIRAFDYLPPVDITFGDYLRALVTADYELVPDDHYGQRGLMIEAFRQRGIYPENVASLAEESLIWQYEGGHPLPPFPTELLGHLATAAGSFGRYRGRRKKEKEAFTSSFAAQYKVTLEADYEVDDRRQAIAAQAHRYATDNAELLALDPAHKIEVAGFHSVFRVAPDGQLLIELVVQFAQKDDSLTKELGGIPFRGGTTLVVSADGTVRYAISKPLPSAKISGAKQKEAKERLERQRGFISLCDARDPRITWANKAYINTRMERRARFSSLCQGFSS
jgi:hypothetical protein